VIPRPSTLIALRARRKAAGIGRAIAYPRLEKAPPQKPLSASEVIQKSREELLNPKETWREIIGLLLVIFMPLLIAFAVAWLITGPPWSQ
jgi:hypothetical protein